MRKKNKKSVSVIINLATGVHRELKCLVCPLMQLIQYWWFMF